MPKAKTNQDVYDWVMENYGSAAKQRISELIAELVDPKRISSDVIASATKDPEPSLSPSANQSNYADLILMRRFPGSSRPPFCTELVKALPNNGRQHIYADGQDRYTLADNFERACWHASRDAVRNAVPQITQAAQVAKRERAAQSQQAEAEQLAKRRQERKARRELASEEAKPMLAQYPVKWQATEKTDEMSGERVMQVRGDFLSQEGPERAIRLEISCRHTSSARVLKAEVSAFRKVGTEWIGSQLPSSFRVRFGNSPPENSILIADAKYRNAGRMMLTLEKALDYPIVRAEIDIDGGPVLMRIVPYQPPLRKVLESCDEV